MSARPRHGRLVTAAVAVVVGASTAVLGTVAHLGVLPVGAGPGGSLRLPTGVLLALVLTACAHLWLGAWSGSRVAMGVCGVAWFAVCVAATVPRPEGDLLLPTSTRGYAWLFLGVLVPVVIAFLPVTAPSRPRPASAGLAPAPAPAPARQGRR